MGKALVVQWGWTKAQAALPFTASTVAFSITMIFAGRMQDKAGPKKIALLGGIMLGLGLMLSALPQAKSPMIMLLTFGLVGGIGIGLGYSATTPPALKWFPASKKGMIAGIVVSGIGLSPVIMSPLTEFLLKIGSIPSAFLALGVGSAIITSLLVMGLRNPPAGYVPAGSPAAGSAKAAPARREIDWAEMISTPQFWMLWVILALTASAGLMIIAHLATIAKLQAKTEWGYIAVVTLALFNTSGRLVGGFFSDKIGRSRTMILFFVLQAINMFLFKNYNTPSLLLFGAAFTGVCYGTIFPLFPATTADFYGMKNLGVNYGFVFTAFGVAGALGPIMAGKIVDATKSYNNAYLVCAVLLIVGAALAVFLRAPKAALRA